MRRCLVATALLLVAASLPAQGRVRGVVTIGATPAAGYSVTLTPGNLQATTGGDGFFELSGVPAGDCSLRIHDPRHPSARLDVGAAVSSEETTLLVDLVPYYAAARPPLDIDWRLHRSWGNALDNPVDLNSWNSLNERDGTLSGMLLKPVYVAALMAEALWTPAGYGVGNLVSFVRPQGDASFFCAGALLTGYLPIEGMAKLAEVYLRAVLWPVDRAVTWPERMILDSYREATLAQHSSPETQSP